MGLKDRWAASRERDRQLQEAEAARMRVYLKTEQLRRMGAAVSGASGPTVELLTEADLDAKLAAETQRQAELYIRFVSAGTLTAFRAFGVQVLSGGNEVYTIGVHDPDAKTNSSQLLGSLTGAEAQVTDGTQAFSWGKAMVMPLATAPLARKETADALIVFPDGTVHSAALNGSQAVREARKECVQFNALAATVVGPAGDIDGGAVARLERLRHLLDAGLLSQSEYDAKRAEIIRSI